ncbi:MAG: homoserine kinase [Acidobacteriota bacterium]
MVRVFAPATVSNLGPGFDVLGLALARPGDIVEAETSDRPGVALVEVTGEQGALPRDAGANSASVAAADVLRRYESAAAGRPAAAPAVTGIWLRLHKQMPLASGLGSSGASAAAGAFAANELLGRPFSSAELVESAAAGERAACGSPHADNVAPSLLGGITLVRSYDPLEVVRLPVPAGLFVVAVHPHCKVSTARARALLAACRFPLPDIVANAGNLAAMVAALYRGDLPLLGRTIEDRLVEPVRAELIPGFGTVRRAALEAGALGCSISGSGPTLFALADADDGAARVALAMRAAFKSAAGLESDAWMGPVSGQGARVVHP